MFHIGENNVVRPSVIEDKSVLVVACRIHRMTCLNEQTCLNFPYWLFIVNQEDSHRSDSSRPFVTWRNSPLDTADRRSKLATVVLFILARSCQNIDMRYWALSFAFI